MRNILKPIQVVSQKGIKSLETMVNLMRANALYFWVCNQNRCQKVFNREALRLCAGGLTF